MKNAFLILSSLLVLACNNHPDYATSEIETVNAPAINDINYDENNTNSETERKLIKEGYITFESDDIAQSSQQIIQAVKQFGGYVSSQEESKAVNYYSNTIVVRINADRFDDFLAKATENVSQFTSKNINIKDVTEEFVDIEARLNTKKALELRYLDLLKKATSVTDILSIEQQIGNLRADIESIEGRLNYLKNQVAISTLTFRITQKNEEAKSFGYDFKNAFGEGWQNLLSFFIFLLKLWPFVLIAIIIGFATILIAKKSHRKKQTF